MVWQDDVQKTGDVQNFWKIRVIFEHRALFEHRAPSRAPATISYTLYQRA